MSDEIDISKLHGVIKEYALMAERDSKGSKGYGKLNTTQELNLFKEMVIKNGKQKELIKQVPNIKGVTVPVKDKKSTKQQDLNKRIIDLMKDKESSPDKMRELVAQKQKIKKKEH